MTGDPESAEASYCGHAERRWWHESPADVTCLFACLDPKLLNKSASHSESYDPCVNGLKTQEKTGCQ